MRIFHELGELGELFKKHGITNDEELEIALKQHELNIGIFTEKSEINKNKF